MLLIFLALAGTPAPRPPVVARPPVLVAPPPVIAPPAVQALSEADRPSEAEALAFVHAYSPSAMRRENELRILRRDFLPTMQKQADTAAMLKAFPALGPALIDALAQNIDVYMREYDERFTPRAVAIVRSGLSRADVKTLTAFYASPLGQRVLAAASSHVDGSEVAQAGLEGRAFDPDMAKRQMMAAGWGALADLGADDRAKVMEQAFSPAGQHLVALIPQLTALQAELANEPGPEFKRRSEAAMADAFRRVTGISVPATK